MPMRLVLKDYYANNDNDQGSVLLRGADTQKCERRAPIMMTLLTREIAGFQPRPAWRGPAQRAPLPGSPARNGHRQRQRDALGTLYAALAARAGRAEIRPGRPPDPRRIDRRTDPQFVQRPDG